MNNPESPSESFTVGHATLLGLGIASVTAIALTFGPSKTGRRGGLGPLLLDDPTWLQSLTVNFIATLALVATIGVFAAWRLRGDGNEE